MITVNRKRIRIIFCYTIYGQIAKNMENEINKILGQTFSKMNF
jgi:hypothetical protein